MNADFLQQLTVKELRALASKHDVANRSKLRRKSDLVAALLEVAQPNPTTKPLTLPTEAPPAASSPSKQNLSPAEFTGEPNPGLPIPDSYGQDRIVIMPQDPHHLFAYWETSGGALEKAQAELGENGVAVLLIHSPLGTEQRIIDLASGNYYLSVAPNTCFKAQLALRASDGRLIIIAESEPVDTPPDSPSERTDESWMAVDEQFDELLVRAGLPGESGSSAQLSESMRRRLWEETGINPLSSGAIASSWSSHTLVKK